MQGFGAGSRLKAARFPTPEFIAVRPRTPRLLWVLLLAAIAAALVATIDATGAWNDRHAAADRLAQLKRSQRDTAGPAAPSVPTSAQRAMHKRLAMPWRSVFVAAESASVDGVQWLALQCGSERNELRLQGLLTGTQDPSAVVGALAAQPGWKDVVLNRLQPDPQGGVRFDISARPE
jgi:hypothetical protein